MTGDPLVGGVVLSRYHVEQIVAHGGMASVYRARDPVLSRTVALKVVHTHLANDPSCVERFRREALAAAGLSHPGVIAIFDTGDVGDRPCLVMEYLAGGALAHRLRYRPPAVDEVIDIGACVARALHEAHRNNLVHRDVKPGNILFTESGTAKLGDFGIAKAGSDSLTQTGQIVGTARYLAPEQLRGQPASAASDQFALGVVLYEALSGRQPYGGPDDPTGGLVRTFPVSPLAEVASVPTRLSDFVSRAMADDPEHRFATLEDLARALETARDVGVGRTPPRAFAPPPVDDLTTHIGAPPPPPHRRARSRVPMVVGACFAVIALAVAALLALRASRAGDAEAGTPTTAAPVAGSPTRITKAKDFDPPPGDNAEHSSEVAHVFDGNPATVWTTSTYEDRDPFPALKPGVGVWVDLGEARRVSAVRVVSPDRGWEAEIRVHDGVGEPTRLEEFGPVVGTTTSSGPEARVDATGRRVLVWITDLPDRRRLAIGEIEVSTG